MSKGVAIIFSAILLSLTIAVLGYWVIKAYKNKSNNSLHSSNLSSVDYNLKDQELNILKAQVLQMNQIINDLRVQLSTCSVSKFSGAGGVREQTDSEKCPSRRSSGRYIPKIARKLPAVPRTVIQQRQVLELNQLPQEEVLELPDNLPNNIISQNQIASILDNNSYGTGQLVIGPDTIYSNNNTIYGGGSNYGGGRGRVTAGAPVPGMVIPFLGALGLLAAKRKRKLKKQ